MKVKTVRNCISHLLLENTENRMPFLIPNAMAIFWKCNFHIMNLRPVRPSLKKGPVIVFALTLLILSDFGSIKIYATCVRSN